MTPHQGSLLAPDPSLNGRGQSHRDAVDTEREAASRIAPVTGTRRVQLLRAYVEAGERGLTDFESARVTRMRRSGVCGRRSELIKQGLVRDSGTRRVDPVTDMRCVVYVATEAGRGAL